MATVTRDSIKLSIEVQNGVDKDGTPKFVKKGINFLLKDDVSLETLTEKAGPVMVLVGDVLEKNTQDFFITESSELEN